MRRLAITIATVVLVASCGSPLGTPQSGAQVSTDANVPASVPTIPAGSCHARHIDVTDPQSWEPDATCTPGAIDGGLSAAQLCPVAHTKAIRPPVSYTDALKKAQMRAYGDSGSPSAFEEDHLVSLELGGAPRDPLNLWPEPHGSPNAKDAVENAAHTAVCSGRVSLSDVQHRMATDWVSLGHDLGVKEVSR